jgi:hypothetical protein
VKRERRILIALLAAAAAVTAWCAPSNAALVDDEYSYTQPAGELVMPFDATTSKASFLIVSNITGTSSFGGGRITTHWEFWNEDCSHLLDTSVCLTLNDTVVMDPRSIQGIAEDNTPIGPKGNLDGFRGLVTITAYETDSACNAFGKSGEIGFGRSIPLDDAIVGAFTIADTTAGYSFGNDALGLGLSSDGSHFVVPRGNTFLSFDIMTLNPQSLDNSAVILVHLKASNSTVRVIPSSQKLNFSTNFIDNLEVSTSLPDTGVSCVNFTTVKGGLIPSNFDVNTSGLVRLSRSSPALTANDYLWGIHGQAVGTFGGSSSIKDRGSASAAFVDAPQSLIE